MSQENTGNISELKQAVFNDFAPINPYVYRALETAHAIIPESLRQIITNCKIECDESILHRINSFLRPTLIRSITQLILQSNNVITSAVTEEKSHSLIENWDRLILSNNGLAGSYVGRQYKILKGIKGHTLSGIMPPPGQSERKRSWYCNSHLEQARMRMFSDEPLCILKLNTMYIWLDSNIGISLYLGCPKWGSGNHVIPLFIEPVPHPIEQMPELPRTDEIIEQLELEKLAEDFDQLISTESTQETSKERTENGETSDEFREENLRNSN